MVAPAKPPSIFRSGLTLKLLGCLSRPSRCAGRCSRTDPQQRRVIPAWMPRPEHTGRERPATRARSARPGHRHALPDNRPGHQRTRLPRPPRGRETARDRGRTHGDARPTRRPASSRKHAAGAARPWPSVEQPTVRTDRDEARIPSAIRPWTPRHAAPQRYKMTHHGTEKNGPHSREFLASGPFSQVVAGELGFEPT